MFVISHVSQTNITQQLMRAPAQVWGGVSGPRDCPSYTCCAHPTQLTLACDLKKGALREGGSVVFGVGGVLCPQSTSSRAWSFGHVIPSCCFVLSVPRVTSPSGLQPFTGFHCRESHCLPPLLTVALCLPNGPTSLLLCLLECRQGLVCICCS